MAATVPPLALESVRLSEQLAIVDEINDDAAHELAVVAIQLSLLSSGRAQDVTSALQLAREASHRTLEAMRRVRRMLEDAVVVGPDRDRLRNDASRVRALARCTGSSLAIADDLPASSEAGAGLVLTAFRIAEAALRFTAHREAQIGITCDQRWIRITVVSALAASEWAEPHDEVERVRERVRWFDGHLVVDGAAGVGSRVCAELPL
jgi:hypothetical protein